MAANILSEKYTLSDGKEIPKLGFGTWFLQGDEATQCVKDAINTGYRLIDTAQAYGNETEVGKGIRASGIAREDLFVVSKVAAELKDYEGAKASIEKSFKAIDAGPIDLMLIHSPQPWDKVNQSDDRYYEGNRKAWHALEDAVDAGMVCSIGVSNFTEGDIENILGDCRIRPVVNQILCHAGHTPHDLISWCEKEKIQLMSYSPLGHGELLKDKLIVEIADKYNVSPAQILIRYDLQLSTVTIVKSSSLKRMEDNAQVDFTISDDDMKTLKEMVYLNGYGDYNYLPVYGGRL